MGRFHLHRTDRLDLPLAVPAVQAGVSVEVRGRAEEDGIVERAAEGAPGKEMRSRHHPCYHRTTCLIPSRPTVVRPMGGPALLGSCIRTHQVWQKPDPTSRRHQPLTCQRRPSDVTDERRRKPRLESTLFEPSGVLRSHRRRHRPIAYGQYCFCFSSSLLSQLPLCSDRVPS